MKEKPDGTPDGDLETVGSAAKFTTTDWGMIQSAGNGSDAALERLCTRYWMPLYFYARRKGLQPEDARDAVQEFFAHLLSREVVAKADRSRGLFRTFLLSAYDFYTINVWRRGRAQKRGGGVAFISIHETDAEGAFLHDPGHNVSPDILFDRQFALMVLKNSLKRLEEECRKSGKAELFAVLLPSLAAQSDGSTARENGLKLGINEGAARASLLRLRQRLREVFFEEVGLTTLTREDRDEEVKYLLSLLQSESL